MAGEGPSLLDGIDAALLEELKQTKIAEHCTSVFVDARYTEKLLQNTIIQEKMQEHSMRRQETPVAVQAAPLPPPKRKIPSPVVAEMYSTDEDDEDTDRRYSGVTRNINIVIPRKQ